MDERVDGARTASVVQDTEGTEAGCGTFFGIVEIGTEVKGRVKLDPKVGTGIF